MFNYLYKWQYYYLLLSLFSIFTLTFILSSVEVEVIYVFFLFSIASFVVFDFYLSFFVFLFLIFTPYVYSVHQSIFFAIIVFISVTINFKSVARNNFKNSLFIPLLLFFSMSIISLVNTTELLSSLLEMFNLLSLIFIFYATIVAFKDINRMKKVFLAFIFFVFIHSLYVDYLGITTGKRIFGLLYVYYIDYAGLGAIASFILFLYSKGLKKILPGIAFIVIMLGLIITQTRNAWLSFAVAIISLLVFLIYKSDKLFLKKYAVLSILAGTILVMIVVVLNSSGTNNNFGERLDIKSQTVELNEDDPYSVENNSFVTRIFIWHTAIMAFSEHPIIGIGSYSFMYTSQKFYKIPKGFYKLYVKGLKPHITYLQVLTETGVIGFISYIVLIISIIKLIVKTLRLQHKSAEDVVLTLMISWSLVYIVFSMLMTDAWSYGPYICWLGVLLGFLVNNYKRLLSNG